MSQVPIESFFYTPSSGSGMSYRPGGPPNTNICHSSGRDNGVVQHLSKLLGGGVNSHSSISSMSQNLMQIKRGRILVGHGSNGMFEVGDGAWGYSNTGHVSLYNESFWLEDFKKLWVPLQDYYNGRYWFKLYCYLDIYACSVAGGVDGLKFLQRVSDVTNCRIRAFTGLIYVGANRIYYEKGHRHVRVCPTGGPPEGPGDGVCTKPEDITKIAFVHDDFLSNKLKKSDLFSVGMEAEDVISILVKSRNKVEISERLLPPETASTIFKILFYSQPFTKVGTAIGLITANIIINYRSQPSLEINVFSDGIAETSYEGQSFMVAPYFRETINQLLIE